MWIEYRGEFYALSAALTWATALVLFKLSGERVAPLSLNLFKNAVALLLMIATLLLTQDGIGAIRSHAPSHIVVLMISGVLGIALADTVFFHSLNLLGVGLIAIVECCYSPLVILFSVLLLSEKVTLSLFVGAAMIVVAVLVCSRHMPPAQRTRKQIIHGFLYGALAMALMALGIVIAKPVLDTHQFPVLWAAMLRLLAGTVALMVVAATTSQWKEHRATFRPSAVWKVSVPAAILGSYLAMIFWVAGFKYARASTAGILNQTSTVFALVLATVVLKERFTLRKLASLLLALGGVAMVTLNTR